MRRTILDPLRYQKIVGATFAKHDHRPLIVIGPRTWDRWELGRLGCPHPVAALRVQRVIKTLGIETVADFLAQAADFPTYRDIGVASYWVVLAILHDLGHDIEATHGVDNPTFATVHKRAMKEGKENAKKRITRARRRGRT